MTEDPIALVVRADSKYKKLSDLLADMKSKKIAIAGGSTGTQDQFMVASIYQKLGKPKNMNYIAYAGGGGALGGIMSDATFAAAVSGFDEFAPQIQAGKLRLLGISFSKRVPGIAGKTLSEQGMPVVVANWRGLALPAGTSKANRDKFIRAMSVMRVSTSWKSVVANRNYIDAFMSGDRFNSWVKGQERAVSAAFTKLGL
jgi:putative tricarboxylic transport membrane protein